MIQLEPYPQHPLPPSDGSRNESESDPAEACLVNPSHSPGAQHRGPPAYGAGVLCNLSAQEGNLTLSLRRAFRPTLPDVPLPFSGDCSQSQVQEQLLQLLAIAACHRVKLVAHSLVTSCRGGSQKNSWIYFGCKKGGCL